MEMPDQEHFYAIENLNGVECPGCGLIGKFIMGDEHRVIIDDSSMLLEGLVDQLGLPKAAVVQIKSLPRKVMFIQAAIKPFDRLRSSDMLCPILKAKKYFHQFRE